MASVSVNVTRSIETILEILAMTLVTSLVAGLVILNGSILSDINSFLRIRLQSLCCRVCHWHAINLHALSIVKRLQCVTNLVSLLSFVRRHLCRLHSIDCTLLHCRYVV